jgi:hypothetical protein
VIREAGYTVFGFFGEHYFFHQPEDTAEETMPQLLEPIGRALAEVQRALEPPQLQTGRKAEEKPGSRPSP